MKQKKIRGNERICWKPLSLTYSMYPDAPNQMFFAASVCMEKWSGSDSGSYQSKKRKRTKVYHSLLMSYTELLPILIQNYGISVILARPRRPPYPKKHDVSAKCEYHGGVGGHSMENCTAFKDKVQSLINVDPIKFRRLVNSHQKY